MADEMVPGQEMPLAKALNAGLR
ncbi:MAG: hypothetical protein JWO10_1838, partial [Microbacteriaceae bacterium]|nr:hypothetical protein [Microbacteriaceae bacterium]